MLRALLCTLFLMLVSQAPLAGETDSSRGDPVTFSLPAIQPWAERSPEGERSGLLVDMVEEIRDRTDIPIRYHIRPHTRAILELEEGHADFVPTFVAPGMARIGKPIAHILSLDVLVLGRADEKPIESLADLEGENVGYLNGTWYGRAFANSDSIRKVPVNNVAHGLRLLRKERLKAVVATEVAIPSGFKPDEADTPVRTLLTLGTVEGKLYMSRATRPEEAAAAIATAMEAMHEDGTMSALFSNRYQAGIASE
ncbi:MAG: substrate-binding periplasmic protein [Pseudomonadota bacterium]